MRTAASLAFVALVVLSGCCQPVPGDGVTATRQPTERDAPSMPPGVGADGVEDLPALLAAHRRTLVDGGFVLETETTRRGPGGPNATTRHRVVAAPGLAAHRHYVTGVLDGGRTVGRQRWTDGATDVRRVLENGTVAGRAPYDGDDASALTRVHRLRWFLQRGDFDVSTTAVRGWSAGYLLEADGPFAAGAGERGHLSARLVVTPQGRIASMVATVTTPDGDGPGVRVESFEYHLREAGKVTVTRPDWVGRVTGERTGRSAADRSGPSAADRPGQGAGT